ncbi:MAG: YqjK family protein [Burkholderiales bacterium]
MSAEQHIALALRKERIVIRVGQQREQLALLGGRLRKPCAVADKALEAGRYVKAHPWTAGAAVGVAVLMGRRHLFRLAGYAWSAWRAWRFIGGWVQQTGFINRFKNK